jgi:hypothetical protein
VFAVYRSDPGPVHLAAEHGGDVELDAAGLEGQARRRVQTDLDAWHWEGLALPAGVRAGPFRTTIDVGDLAVRGRFGPNGMEGRLNRGPFGELSDLVLLAPGRGMFGVRTSPEGALTVGPNDALAPGQYMSGTVLTDRQQRRQELYRRFFSRPTPRHLDGRAVVLAWSDSAEPPFTTERGDRTVGATLLIVPVEFERTTAGSAIVVPSGFIPYTALLQGRPVRPTLESSRPASNRLQFKIPPSVLPMTVERATLQLRVKAPSRRVAVSAYSKDKPELLKEVESPIDPIRVDVTDPRYLKLDAEGNLHLSVEVGARVGSSNAEPEARDIELDEIWRIESILLEVAGRVEAKDGK